MFTGHLSLMGKIIHIADVYEAMTHERVYRPKPFTSDEVLRKMWEEAGKSFDKILLKRFIHMMGIYPIGSVVELSDGDYRSGDGLSRRNRTQPAACFAS